MNDPGSSVKKEIAFTLITYTSRNTLEQGQFFPPKISLLFQILNSPVKRQRKKYNNIGSTLHSAYSSEIKRNTKYMRICILHTHNLSREQES